MIVQALFRIVEPTSGKIFIDSLDITEMGLFDLRSRLALVPQVSHRLCNEWEGQQCSSLILVQALQMWMCLFACCPCITSHIDTEKNLPETGPFNGTHQCHVVFNNLNLWRYSLPQVPLWSALGHVKPWLGYWNGKIGNSTVQDPVVFSGSIRANLDPFDSIEGDARIWQALEQAGLQQTIANLPVILSC